MIGMGVGVGMGLTHQTAGGAAGWTPAELSDFAWFDFSDSDTVTTDGNGITAVTNKGDWGGNLGVVGAASTQPAHVAGPNSLMAGSFDGGDGLKAAISHSGTAQLTAIVAMKIETAEAFDRILSAAKGTGGDHPSTQGFVFQIDSPDATKLATFRNSLFLCQNVPYAINTWERYESRFDGSDNTVFAEGSGGTPVSSTDNFDFDTVLIGVGQVAGPSFVANIDALYGEAFVFKAPLSAENLTLLMDYLTRWQ